MNSSAAGEPGGLQLSELCDLLTEILQQELSALEPKEDFDGHDEARVKSALNCMKAMRELEEMKIRNLNLEDRNADEPEDLLELYQRLRRRADQIVKTTPRGSRAVSG